MTKTVVLGIGGYTTDASACLLVDGEVVGAVAEERFTRAKHVGGWPARSIEFLLRDAGLRESDIGHVAFAYDPWLRLSRRLPYRALKLPRRPLVSSLLLLEESRFVAGFMIHLRALAQRAGAKIHTIRHHLCHAASSYLTSPWDESAIYTFDMRGEWDTAILAHGRGPGIDILDNTRYPHSLGIFYAGMTQFLGFGPNDEYKVMGLASYGNPVYADELAKVIRPAPRGQFKLDTSYLKFHDTRGYLDETYFSRKFYEEFGPARRKAEPVDQRIMDLAASGQAVFERCAHHQLTHLHTLTQSPRVCLAGGCAMNGAMNGRITTETPFEHVFLPSAAGDDGLALGGALWVYVNALGRPRPPALLRADLGPAHSDDAIERVLRLYKLDYERHDDVVPVAADLLQQGLIVGWFQGRMEYGARALGNRSILGNPTLPGMKDKINAQVKFREEFRPFAPSVIEEAADRYYELPDPVPFMTVVVRVKEEAKRRLPATTHVDGTSRVQTVSAEHAPLYHRLIKTFGERSGVPVVLNTSFNVMGEPIVESPAQAIRCFFSCGMDALVIGSFVLKKPHPTPTAG